MSHSTRWTLEKITQRLALIEPLVYRQRAALPNFRFFSDAEESGVEILPYTYWGKPGINFRLRGSFLIPPAWDKQTPVALYLPLGDAGSFSHPEALIHIDGQSFAACDRHHQEVLLPPALADGKPHELLLDGWTGLDGSSPEPSRLIMRPCAVAQIDQTTRELVTRTRVALMTAKNLDGDNPTRARLLNALDAAYKILDTREPFGEGFYESAGRALAALTSGIREAGEALDVGMTATGHAHIDVAWLWTLGQTRRKAARTFHNVMRLMEQFPDYHFTQSQPQLYEYIRQDHPALFEQIKKRVAERRWEPIGGMWVEADCNLSGAESLARQFLLGRSYFRRHFGPEAESRVLWLPDVFGYAWALPQLIKQAGLEYFFTIKLGWNQYNRIPYDSFWWQGLDGTRVLTHFSTAPENGSAYTSTYNAPADAESTLHAWKNFQQKESQEEVFMAFGYGDGGGGPTREMLENLQEMEHFPGLPQARQRPALDFFSDLEANSGDQLPTWNGELYLELHRGTYTTQSRNKRANRKSEFALHDAEFLASLAARLDPDYAYPAEALNRAWELVCLNQFHDIIPGSSIGAVYVESQEQYAEVARLAQGARETALTSLAAQVGGDWLLANPTSFAQRGPVLLPGETGAAFERDGQPLDAQRVEGGMLVDPGELPPYSLTSIRRSSGAQAEPGELANANNLTALEMENDALRVEFDASGDIRRIYDKANQREVLPNGSVANQFQALEDRPMNWEAWDIDIFSDDKMWLAEPAESIRMLERGALQQTVEIRRRILNSHYTQRITLRKGSARLDFETVIDWRERHILLKTAFPVEILSPEATYEIQWGNVTRPTHRNTSWDWARFETCAHKWVDLSEGGYGVSLLNDCKYGHDILENVMRLSLLRSPTDPDPQADQGEQRFTYSLLPHAGGWQHGTQAEAYALNDPVIAFRAESAAAKEGAFTGPALRCSAPNIVIETIKRAEDGRGWIARLYESQRMRGNVTLTGIFPLGRVERVNLLEETLETLQAENGGVTLFVKPFEIISLRFAND